MRRFALMLTILAVVGFAAAVGTTRADSLQIVTVSNGTTETIGGSTYTVPPVVTVVSGCAEGQVEWQGKCGVPDTEFYYFKRWRIYQREQAHKAQSNKCRNHERFHFIHVSRDIAPWNRTENINHWKAKKERAKARTSKCIPTNPRELGKYLAARMYGWTGYQWTALDSIAMRESGWNPCRHYPSTTDCGYSGPYACGIPQAVPCSKLLYWCGASSLGGCSAYRQIVWMLNYIRARYGSPSAALANGSTY